MSGSHAPETSGVDTTDYFPTRWTETARVFSWAVAVATFVFAANCYLEFGLDWPGFLTLVDHLEIFGPTTLRQPLAGTDLTLAWLQAASYALCLIGPAVYVRQSRGRTLRQDADTLSAVTNYIVRAAFWMVVLVGLADMVISFLRVEGFLQYFVGEELTTELGRSRFRGPYIHIPLIGLALVVGLVTRSLSFVWLTLLVVVAELLIVVSRFIFSYEQAFQGDLVRFWYAALFLFASAYTLFEDGHVRVDVLYSGFTEKTKGAVNAAGSLLLGISLCWVILFIGIGGKSSIIINPLLNFEVSQSGFGMYVKYLMAGFLGIFAITMMIQFVSTFLEGIADYREDPGHRKPGPETAH
jgi:TRAP-type mannitol/chloroaromatic compound transport system permease small subunit